MMFVLLVMTAGPALVAVFYKTPQERIVAWLQTVAEDRVNATNKTAQKSTSSSGNQSQKVSHILKQLASPKKQAKIRVAQATPEEEQNQSPQTNNGHPAEQVVATAIARTGSGNVDLANVPSPAKGAGTILKPLPSVGKGGLARALSPGLPGKVGLPSLPQSIDRNHDAVIDADELQAVAPGGVPRVEKPTCAPQPRDASANIIGAVPAGRPTLPPLQPAAENPFSASLTASWLAKRQGKREK
jgi:hypothetical protein